ncbi:UDP-3-O-acyl-N-acetylglucosamine deacetylase [Azospirillum halopraeferens]|uniref:UDP-3-O-acyl-N-acetylglucosamine deacetylase n=1 Tax=Azospirillum halopraeferens TaxID=34010 RepID=UPI00040C0C4B|nr:UDP-3-O-acyl-N-acetylglucosamine deacetylase [Azospirillum halopraeferens]
MTHIRATSNGLFQHTLRSAIHTSGIGLHSGSTVRLTIAPADAGTGITFIRTDKRGDAALIPAAWDAVADSRLCSVIANADRNTVGTVEHLMAALAGCGIDNAEVRIDAGEVPIMDGSSAPFVAMIERAGRLEQAAPRRAIRILKPVYVTEGSKVASLVPGEGTTYSFEIDFDNAVVARQTASFDLVPGSFAESIARARTFGFLHEVDAMRRAGLALGGSLDNAIVIDRDRVLNEDGLRFEDEFVRHKILDAVGDLYLAGAPIIGHFHGCRSSHALNNKLLHALFADRSAWCYDIPAAILPAWSDCPARAVA